MSHDRRAHWDRVHEARADEALTWFQPRPAVSLELIEAAGVGPISRIVDVGAGISRLADHLIDAGYREITVVDVSEVALARTRARLGARGDEVRFVVADVTAPDASIGGPFDLWHDRAVFHFLVEAEDRARYLALLERTLAPGGHVIIATFAEDGPDRCSGLPVVRYSAEALARELGGGYTLVDRRTETHRTPKGGEQAFLYTLFRSVAGTM